MKEYVCRYKSAHYDFYCKPDSFALKNITEIAERQEECYKKITEELNIYPDFRLEYWLADTPRELGVLYGDGEPCNGFVKRPNKIFAVYNDAVKGTGMHEDAHIISFSLKKPTSAFISEGLAMYFDKEWQGRSNEVVCRELLDSGLLPDVPTLLDNDKFFATGEEITYPLSGSFTKFLVKKLTMEAFLRDIYYNDAAADYLNNLFRRGIIEEFSAWIESA
ncbi:MAG: hypothetical protein LUD27_02550 [Clostridia bacterium]|nr:hypothetical protein [Clostridia bacterium]